MKINQSGRSMIEMLGVLAIIGVLSAAGLYGYQKAMMKHKANKTINQMATIINNIHTAFSNSASSQKPYSGMCDRLASLHRKGSLPRSLLLLQQDARDYYGTPDRSSHPRNVRARQATKVPYSGNYLRTL